MAPVWGKRTRTFCGEIQYWSSLRGNGWIHSDICPSHDEETVILTEAYRKYLHECLDEWLDHSNGTGAFWVGNREHLFED